MGDLEWTEGLDEWAGQGEAVIQAPGPSAEGNTVAATMALRRTKTVPGGL
jgi:hypothetical protein